MGLDATLFGQMITFLIFVGLTVKFIWPKMTVAMQERRKKIADGLAAAERGHQELEVAQRQARDIIQEAKAQATVIVEKATQRAHHIEEEAKETAREMALRIKKNAQSEVEQQVIQAQEALRAELSELIIAGAKKIVGEHLSAAANEALVEKLAKEVQG